MKYFKFWRPEGGYGCCSTPVIHYVCEFLAISIVKELEDDEENQKKAKQNNNKSFASETHQSSTLERNEI